MPLGARLTVSSRFLLVLGIGLVFQAGISVGSLLLLKQSLQQDRINEVKHLLESAYSTVVFYHDQADKGLLTDAQAQQAAAAAIRAMRYDGTNYFCIWDLNGFRRGAWRQSKIGRPHLRQFARRHQESYGRLHGG